MSRQTQQYTQGDPNHRQRKRFKILPPTATHNMSAVLMALLINTLTIGTVASEAYPSPADNIVLDEMPVEYGNLFDTRKLSKNGIDGWAVSFDNDVFVPSSRDQDYTYGVNVTVAGDGTRNYALSLDGPLNRINRLAGVDNSTTKPVQHAFEFGVYGFTPEDISNPDANPLDRPYASIIYVSGIQELQTPNPNISWRTSLTVGVMGLDIVGDLQNDVHRAIDSQRAEGWEHQISDGGELTTRYSVARQRLWRSPLPSVEVKTTAQASVGYLTEASYGVSLRFGRIASRWQSFNPELTSYGEQTNQSVDEQYKSESYWMLGAAVKARVYNAFLQGQFRSSDVEYNRGDLNTGLVEAWAGYSHSFKSGFRLTYLLRGHTSELKRGAGDRNVVWGGLTLSRTF